MGDRLSCDALEFEGRPPLPSSSGSGGSPPLWVPTPTELAWALLPLVLLAVATRLWGSRVRRAGGAVTGGMSAVALLRSRCASPRLASPAPPAPACPPLPSPPHLLPHNGWFLEIGKMQSDVLHDAVRHHSCSAPSPPCPSTVYWPAPTSPG